MKLGKLAKKSDVTIIPDCGIAPGLSNMLVGYAASKLDKVEGIHIKVGGLPHNPIPPLGYRITWSVEDLLEEYTRNPLIVQNYKIRRVKALSGFEKVKFKGIGELECFYTNGLRSLLYTMKGVKEMDEKTLMECGFLDKKSVKIDGRKFRQESLWLLFYLKL